MAETEKIAIVASSPNLDKLRTLKNTDAGNGEAFALLHGERFRYEHNKGKWLVWNGLYWAEDSDGEPATVNRMMCRVRHMLNKAVEWGLLEESPMKRLKFLRENNARLRFLSLEECDRLIASCATPHLQAIVTIALHTGMRSGEIRNLTWPDIDFGAGLLRIRDSKNGESRNIALDSTVIDLLRKYPRTSGSGHIFLNAAGKPLKWIQHGFRKAMIRAGLSDLRAHDLRHTFASHWMMSGGELYALKDILGHKTIAMTQRYAHLSPAYRRSMVHRMEQIWAKSNGACTGA